jgi:hypothetical protein
VVLLALVESEAVSPNTILVSVCSLDHDRCMMILRFRQRRFSHLQRHKSVVFLMKLAQLQRDTSGYVYYLIQKLIFLANKRKGKMRTALYYGHLILSTLEGFNWKEAKKKGQIIKIVVILECVKIVSNSPFKPEGL